SPYLKRMMENSQDEDKLTLDVEDLNIAVSDLDGVFCYMYGQEGPMEENEEGRAAVSSLFEMETLTELYCDIMISKLSHQNVVKYLITAHQWKLDRVEEACKEWLCNQLVFTSHLIQQFQDISPEVMMCLLRDGSLVTPKDEGNVYALAKGWIQSQKPGRLEKEIIEEVLGCLRMEYLWPSWVSSTEKSLIPDSWMKNIEEKLYSEALSSRIPSESPVSELRNVCDEQAFGSICRREGKIFNSGEEVWTSMNTVDGLWMSGKICPGDGSTGKDSESGVLVTMETRGRGSHILTIQYRFRVLRLSQRGKIVYEKSIGWNYFLSFAVLGVTRDSAKNEIARAYRALARKHHPDMHKTPEAKSEAETMFKLIATAYEILKDDEARTDYDYMLDHPEEFYSHYYRYYRRRMAPKVDVRIVIGVTITIISAFQYYTAWFRYDMALKHLVTVPKYRLHALEIAKKEGMLSNGISGKKKGGKKSKEELKKEEEETIRRIIENNLDIKGGYAKPSVRDILWLQLILFPYNVFKWVKFQLTWLWKFTIRRQPLGKEEKLYLIRRYLQLNHAQFEVWKEERDEIERRKLAENARYKSYRRYMKNHGPGRITFDDD
ncbi:unnamed protein product, partial [Darwinula stevensoni]